MEFDTDPALLPGYPPDIREYRAKFGEVNKIIVFDTSLWCLFLSISYHITCVPHFWRQQHEEGVAQVFVREAEEADLCIEKLHGRWFAEKEIIAETWDGVPYPSKSTRAIGCSEVNSRNVV
jgi:HIV Tat-specific factor 1